MLAKKRVEKEKNKREEVRRTKNEKKKKRRKNDYRRKIVNHAVYGYFCTEKQYFLIRFRKVIWISSSHIVCVKATLNQLLRGVGQ